MKAMQQQIENDDDEVMICLLRVEVRNMIRIRTWLRKKSMHMDKEVRNSSRSVHEQWQLLLPIQEL